MVMIKYMQTYELMFKKPKHDFPENLTEMSRNA